MEKTEDEEVGGRVAAAAAAAGGGGGGWGGVFVFVFVCVCVVSVERDGREEVGGRWVVVMERMMGSVCV